MIHLLRDWNTEQNGVQNGSASGFVASFAIVDSICAKKTFQFNCSI